MHFTVIFAVLAFSMAVEAVPSARTFASSQHSAHSIPAHNHNSNQHIFPGVQQNTANHGHQVHVEDDSSIAVLVCQVVKVPAGSPLPQPAPAVPATPPIAAGSPSIVVSSQETLSDLTTRVRTAMDSLVAPLAAALQNASLWLNRTSQQHLHQQHQHVSVQHEHAGHNHQHATHNHHSHQHMHSSEVNQAGAHAHQHQHDGHANQHTHPAHSAQGHPAQQAVPAPAVPMTVVSVPVMIPAVHAGSFPLVNLSAVVPASMNVSSLQFTGPVRTATSLEGASAATVPGSNIIGRSGDQPTTMSPATPVTLPSRGNSSAAVSRKFSVRQVATPPPIIHVPVCPDFCCRR
uniref:Putative large his rich 1 n=1 Tax=Rhipicephalus microplus TaxID=6941 RepID=A0A6M2D385_RHIMP